MLVSAEITPDAVVAAVESAASHRIPCVLNPAPVTSGLVELFGLGPVLTPNSSELGELRTLLGEHGTVRFRTWRLTWQLARRLQSS
ncbi:MAG: ribokinase [Mycobacterium sp.]